MKPVHSFRANDAHIVLLEDFLNRTSQPTDPIPQVRNDKQAHLAQRGTEVSRAGVAVRKALMGSLAGSIMSKVAADRRSIRD
jgi:hypothetical protein